MSLIESSGFFQKCEINSGCRCLYQCVWPENLARFICTHHWKLMMSVGVVMAAYHEGDGLKLCE
jgi:hypothetical protein